jgi:cell fate regulator YaaT (PSP1 superfamily)
LEEARAKARARFRERLQGGEQIGECGCAEDDPVRGVADGSPPLCVVGVRFRDSGRVYYFRADDEELQTGEWVVVPTSRGQEAGRVVIAPHQVQRALLRGDVGSVTRRLSESDVNLMASYRRLGAEAVRLLGERSRARSLAIKPIAADYAFDGASVTFSYSAPDRDRTPDAAALHELARELAEELGCRVELRQVGPRDEARLLGGLGRCGRTLCCSSWLPVFPEISMNMAKNQDLPLNPAKVSGVCGRLLCCLSYENEQYRQMKAVMPRLGQRIETPAGPGLVLSLHLLKELVTVRLEAGDAEMTFRSEELGLGSTRVQENQVEEERADQAAPEADPRGAASEAPSPAGGALEATPKRRRRRRGNRRGGG